MNILDLIRHNDQYDVDYVPFELMEQFSGWKKWSNGITCFPFGYYVHDVESFLLGHKMND